MSDRPYDICVFGASGFTGQFVLDELLNNAPSSLRWCASGRSQQRVQDALDGAAQRTGRPVASVDIVVADVADNDSMVAMCRQCQLVINCVGPYRFLGEQVVTACIAGGSDYVDISGEPQFLESMEHKHHDAAVAAKVCIVGSVGFDSIPADIGALWSIRQFDGQVSSIESYLSVKSDPKIGFVGHYTTYQCAVEGFGDAKSLTRLRKSRKQASLPVFGARQKRYGMPRWFKPMGAYALPFPGSDASVVKRTQRVLYDANHEPPVQFSAYFTIASTFGVALFVLFGSIFSFLASSKLGRSILLRFPGLFTAGLFSHAGPTREQMDKTSFSIRFFSSGARDPSVPTQVSRLVTEVSGPEPGYVATPIFAVVSALQLLRDRSAGTLHHGVLTPGGAFRHALPQLVSAFEARGVSFKVVQEQQ